MGRDYHNVDYYNKFSSKKKKILCLSNFSKKTHPLRRRFYKKIKHKKWITKQMKKINIEHFYKQLNQCKFVICPRGNGLETYRFYDTLYSGAIPIVLKENILYDKFKTLPVLILDTLEDLKNMTPQFLDEQYKLLSKKHQSYQRLLDMDYWLKNICDHKNPDEWCN